MLGTSRRLGRLLRLPAAERRLLLETAVLLQIVRLGVQLFPFRVLRSLLESLTPAHSPRDRRPGGPSIAEVSRAVERASRRTPGEKTCLTRALVLRMLLLRRGYPATLRIGVVREGGDRLLAHAWVESAGRVVIGDYQLERYTPILSLGAERA